MKTVNRVLATVLFVTGCVGPAVAQVDVSRQPFGDSRAGAVVPEVVLAAQSQTRQPEQQNEFVPLDQLPPQEQLPAARLLIAAYSFVLAALFFYVVSVSRRVGTVRREVERLESDLKRTGRA